MKKPVLAFLVVCVCLAAPAAFAQTNSNEITIVVPANPAPSPTVGQTPAEPPAPAPAVGQTPAEPPAPAPAAGQTPAEQPAQPAVEPPKEEPKPEPKAEPPKTEPKAAGGGDWKRNLHANIKLNWWIADYTGTVKFAETRSVGGADVRVGSNIDLVDQFDIQNPQQIPEFEAWVALGKKNRLMVDYFSVNYTGQNSLDQTVDFAGVTFGSNTKLDSKITMSRIGLLSDFLPLSGDMGNLGLRYGIEYFIWQIDLKGTESGTGDKIDESKYFPIPIPVVGLAGNLYLPYGFGIYGSFVGIGGNFGTVGGAYTDLDAGLSWSWKYLYTGVGYRSLRTIINYKTDSDEFNVDLSQSGFLFSVGLAL